MACDRGGDEPTRNTVGPTPSTNCSIPVFLMAITIFDAFVEHANNTRKYILIQITVFNRGPERADLHVLPAPCFAIPGVGGRKRQSRSCGMSRGAVVLLSSQPSTPDWATPSGITTDAQT